MISMAGAVTKQDLAKAVKKLRGEMSAMKKALIVEIHQAAGVAARVMEERFKVWFSVLDEKYRDVPHNHTKLRDDFNDHANDFRLHVRPVITPAKQARRPRSR